MAMDVLGAFIAFFAALLSITGTNTQKKSHLMDEKKPRYARVPYYRRYLWWIGFASVIAASVGDFVALGIADQALVASVGGGTTLVANIFVAHFWHGDKIHKTDIAGVFFVVLGAGVFAYSSGDSKEDEIKAKDLPEHFTRGWFLVYLSVQGVVMLVLLAGIGGSYANRVRKDWTFRFLSPIMDEIHLMRRRMDKLEKRVVELGGTVPANSHRLNSRSSMAVLEENTYGERHWTDKYVYAACAGTIGGLSVLLGGLTAKSIGGGLEIFAKPWVYVFAVALVLTLVLQTHFQNRAMQLGDNMSIFPVFQAFWITFSVVSALYFYNTDTSWSIRWYRASGILPMVIGIACLFQHPKKEKIWRIQSMAISAEQIARMMSENGVNGDSNADSDESKRHSVVKSSYFSVQGSQGRDIGVRISVDGRGGEDGNDDDNSDDDGDIGIGNAGSGVREESKDDSNGAASAIKEPLLSVAPAPL